MRLTMVVAVAAAATVALAAMFASLNGVARRSSSGRSSTPRAPGVSVPPNGPTPRRHRPFAVGLRTLRLVDRSRRVRQADGRVVPRTLVTDVRYPALGSSSATDTRGARAAVAAGPYPVVIFGHGFALLPSTYTLLLRAWARSGYVVAAPAFPLERATAPGGPVASDRVNQPGDVRFLISSLLRAGAAPHGALHGLLDPGEIAVGGHSDGAGTASSLAFDPRERDPRVRAVLLFSGAHVTDTARTGRAGPPVLAVQGTADPVHPAAASSAFFAAARRPKYLLRLLGAGHEEPYTTQLPQRRIVERVGLAFLDRYLGHRPDGLRRLLAAGRVPGIASLTAAP
jgi:dienelactone hydrolase